MTDGGNNNAAVVPDIRVNMVEPDTCTTKESMKVFFKPVQENEFTQSEEPLGSVSIKSGVNFEVPLNTKGVHPGWYWAVFCVSLEQLDVIEDVEDILDSINFDVTSKKMSLGVVYKLDYTCKTVIQRDEIRCLPRTKSARLKLHRQIEVTSDTELFISINVKTVPECKEDVSFDLNYFELACRHICSEDHVLWGEGKPDKYIRIGAEDAGHEKVPIAIEASDVSANGKLAVTVYFSPAISDAHIPDGNRNTLYNIAACFGRSSERAGIPDGDRVSDRAYTTGHSSIYNSDQGSAHTPEPDSTHNPDQVSKQELEHAASLGLPQDTQLHALTPIVSHAHSHASDNVQMLGQGYSHTQGSTSTLGVAHIDVWDLSTPSGKDSSDNPQEITKPLATWYIHVPALKKHSGASLEKKSPNDSPQLPKPTINISSTGLHVIMALGWATEAVHAAPFLIYKRDDSAEQNPSALVEYKPVPKTCSSLQAFFGYGAFHNTDPDAPNCENERYFNFHGSTFDVYSTNGSWKQLYSLTFGIKGVIHRPEDMYYLTQSLRGRYLAWAGDRGAVSIWDFETGKFVNTILIPNDTRGVCAALCEDGSMIAITVNGRIQLHDVASGIKLGDQLSEWKEDNGSEIIFRQDYFMALDASKSKSGNKNIDARSIFRARDLKVVKTHYVHWQYAAEYASTLNPIFLYRQGVILNIKRLGNILCPTEDDRCTPDTKCDFEDAKVDLSDNTWANRNQSSAGTTFALGQAHAPSRPLSIMKLNIANVYNNAALSLGPASESRSYSGFYMASSSQLVLILNGFLQVWRLPSEANQKYELVHVEAFVAVSKAHANDICITKASSIQSCTHGRKFIIKIDPIRWVPVQKQEVEDEQEKEAAKGDPEKESMVDPDEEDYRGSDQPQTLTFPRAAGETFLASEKYRYENGVTSLLDTYADSDKAIQDAIIRFLVDRIRHSPRCSSSLVILCRSWKYGNREIFKKVITDLLPATNIITWIPNINATKKDDPLWILTKIAKTCPSVLEACRIIMDYCVNHAITSKNLSFLSPFLRSLRRIMSLFPNEAQVYLRRIAYIPVSDKWRDYIVENSTVVHSPWHCIRFRKTSLRLEKIKKPVMQLHVTTGKKRIKADTFTRPIYVAAFDALWHFKDISECEGKNSGVSAVKQVWIVKLWSTIMQRSIVKQESTPARESMHESMLEPAAPTHEATAVRGQDSPMNHGATKTQTTTWWKTAYHMLRLKCRLKTHTYVTCHDFSLEFLDNPAIAALVAYKWNTIGFAYWAFRFFFQSVFYLLVFVAALLQVYHENVGRTQLKGVFVAIIVMGAVFLWLELLQAIKNFKRYRQDPYNLLDIVAYSLPIVASFIMLMILGENEVGANTRILSYSVLAVFLHMLFELRIYKSVCKYVTIIRQSVLEIRVFFLIFAGGLVAFTVTFLHILRACPVPGACEDPDVEFSKHFLGALSATYFFMGGQFKPVEDELASDDWAFHVAMAVYFFFTVIIMLNVLIALINKAFTKGDDDWRLDWIESRLHYIVLAENLSYHIPGFRQTHNWFPKEIYFAAIAKDVDEYGEVPLKIQVQTLKTKLDEQQEQAMQQFKELKKLLRDRPESNRD